jgi:cytidylate kinase
MSKKGMSVTTFTTNIAFAGLTAAGKTTHARRLAAELGYDYVSATEILLDILGISGERDRVWFTQLDHINRARDGGGVDAELEQRLLDLCRTQRRTVFDTWALAWIGGDPLVRIWIESDQASRTRKCYVSQGDAPRLRLAQCRTLIREKDGYNREIFRLRHGFDLFTDRGRYDVVLCNSQLIPAASAAAAKAGVEAFAPVVSRAVRSVLACDRPGARALLSERPHEVNYLEPAG